MSEIVDDPNPEIRDATTRMSIEVDSKTLQLVEKLFIQEGRIRERERIADWIKAHRTEVADGVWRYNFDGSYLLEHVIPVPESETHQEDGLDYSDYVEIKIIRVRSDGEPIFWQVDFKDGTGGTAPTFAGVIDIACSIITGDDQLDGARDDWADFDANVPKEDK